MSIFANLKNHFIREGNNERDFVLRDFCNSNLHFQSGKKANPVLQLQNISLKFPEMERAVLQDIHLSVFPGDCLVLLGGNGSGKSSLMKLIQGAYIPSKGTVAFLEKAFSDYKRKELAKNLVALTQDLRASLFFELSVLENCLLWALRQGGSLLRISHKSERTFFSKYLNKFHPKLADKLDTPLRLLSGGEKQALLLGLCLLHPPQLLLLDEHTSALDPKQAEYIMAKTMECLIDNKVTSIICTHNLEHALKYGNRLIAIKEGKIILEADNHIKQKLTRKDLLELCY